MLTHKSFDSTVAQLDHNTSP